jgi:DNA adenine methylase
MGIPKKDVELNGCKPLLKWAGGKTQLLKDILPKIPKKFNNYIEPFIGGGALYFAFKPDRAVIADVNPELINLYTTVRDNVEEVISNLYQYKNEEEFFYDVRKKDWNELSNEEAAARTIYLNKTCFNGLYRVNKSGQFNVPFGKYKNPRIVDETVLRNAARLIKDATIVCGDYKSVLKRFAKPDDFIFLDPPYLPVSVYADFKRYTKEQFYEEDHKELAEEVKRLYELGCHVILTNSNHPLVHELYSQYSIEVVQSKRFISSKSSTRTGEDVIVNIPAKKKISLRLVPQPLPEQSLKYPSTRFMGSKQKLLSHIWNIASHFNFETAVDLFSGSGIVGYMFKSQGKQVISNDYMAMSAIYTKAMIENNNTCLEKSEAVALLNPPKKLDTFVQDTFKDLYFQDDDNYTIDVIRSNIKKIKDPYKHAIAMTSLIRACMKKRARGIFTYVGQRYDDGRRDLQKSIGEHFLDAVSVIDDAIFDNGRLNRSVQGSAMDFKPPKDALVYIDPPYYSPFSDNEYIRRYHFVEGLARDWKGIEIQQHTSTKKFKSYPTPFSTKNGAADAFNILFKKFRNNILLVSYSSNSLPSLEEIVSIMAKYKGHVEVIPIDYKYSFGNQGHKINDNKNKVQEYLFVGF